MNKPAQGTGSSSGGQPSSAAVSARSRPSVGLVRPSRALLRFFDIYFAHFFSRHFHALRIAGAEHWGLSAGTPRVVCLNHPSWWDPLTAILLSRYLERDADHYAPMDALAFRRYGILRKVGLFPVDQGNDQGKAQGDTQSTAHGAARGAAQFLRASRQILADQRAVLWLTPQGEFTDGRTRPLAFRPGLDALLRRTESVTVLPLALEYTFWDERLPEALALLGPPLRFSSGELAGHNSYERGRAGAAVAHALASAQDALAARSALRDPNLFQPVLAGSSGIGGIYGTWQRLRARLTGGRFDPEHGSLHPHPGSGDA